MKYLAHVIAVLIIAFILLLVVLANAPEPFVEKDVERGLFP